MFSNVRKVVVKIGTNVLTTGAGGLDREQIQKLSGEISSLLERKLQVVLVSSGAIAAGKSVLGLKKTLRTIPEEQAAAAVGQGKLMQVYSECFGEMGICVGQVLLTQGDLRDRKRYLNARNTILTLLRNNVVPVINENDTVAVDELYFGERFGDNDTLAALVTNLVEAELLVVLTDVDGLMSHKGLIGVVEKVTPEIESCARVLSEGRGKGGMKSKIRAARIVTESGEKVVVANGRTDRILQKVIEGDRTGTLFLPGEGRIAGKKRWIAFTLQPRGSLTVDNGAMEALKKGRSLLASGITDANESFRTGDAVRIQDKSGREFARGIINYSCQEVRKIIGMKSGEIKKILGYKPYDEVIHSDNLVILAW